MAYEMTEITPRVRIGKNKEGDFNIEVWDKPWQDKAATFDEIHLPKDTAFNLGIYLVKNDE